MLYRHVVVYFGDVYVFLIEDHIQCAFDSPSTGQCGRVVETVAAEEKCPNPNDECYMSVGTIGICCDAKLEGLLLCLFLLVICFQLNSALSENQRVLDTCWLREQLEMGMKYLS